MVQLVINQWGQALLCPQEVTYAQDCFSPYFFNLTALLDLGLRLGRFGTG